MTLMWIGIAGVGSLAAVLGFCVLLRRAGRAALDLGTVSNSWVADHRANDPYFSRM
jgi:hypothetical protein